MLSHNLLLKPKFKADSKEYFPSGTIETSKSIFRETGRDLSDRSLDHGLYDFETSQINNGLLPQAAQGSKLVRQFADLKGYDLEMFETKRREISDRMGGSLSTHGRCN
jgi:hypothetical protein